MSVKHANEKTGAGVDDLVGNVTEARNNLGDTVDALAAKTDLKGRATDAVEQGKDVARRRPVPLATAAAGLATAATAVVVLVRRRRARPTPRQRAANAWRGMRKRFSR